MKNNLLKSDLVSLFEVTPRTIERWVSVGLLNKHAEKSGRVYYYFGDVMHLIENLKDRQIIDPKRAEILIVALKKRYGGDDKGDTIGSVDDATHEMSSVNKSDPFASMFDKVWKKLEITEAKVEILTEEKSQLLTRVALLEANTTLTVPENDTAEGKPVADTIATPRSKTTMIWQYLGIALGCLVLGGFVVYLLSVNGVFPR